MLDLTKIDSALSVAESNAKEAASLGKCFNKELMVWILTEVKDIMFRPDGSKRGSFIISKGRMILFLVKLGAKVADCLLSKDKTNDADDVIQH